MQYLLIPQSVRVAHSQLLTGARPLCRSATFPHTVGNHPLQGSLYKSLSHLRWQLLSGVLIYAQKHPLRKTDSRCFFSRSTYPSLAQQAFKCRAEHFIAIWQEFSRTNSFRYHTHVFNAVILHNFNRTLIYNLAAYNHGDSRRTGDGRRRGDSSDAVFNRY